MRLLKSVIYYVLLRAMLVITTTFIFPEYLSIDKIIKH